MTKLRIKNFAMTQFSPYNAEMPQCLPAMLPAGPKRETPTMTMAGAMVSGVMNRRTSPTIPLCINKNIHF